MEINLNLKNVKRISYELYDGSKIELDDGSFVKDDSYNKKSVPKMTECEVSRNTLEAYENMLYDELTSRIKDKFNEIMDKADKCEINHDTLEAYEKKLYDGLTNRIKDKFNEIMEKADEWEIKNHYARKNKEMETKNYYKTIK